MDKYITIEWPYERITLDFSRVPKVEQPLPADCWDLLVKCEKPLYSGEYGANAWTDVMPNEGNTLLNEMWEQATLACEGVDDDTREATNREAARRVAAALAILSFGKEFLLK